MAVILHIGELVLHGFDPRDHHAIAGGVQSELASLFADSAPPRQSASIDAIDAGTFPIDDVRSESAPRAIAGAVHREVTR